MLIYLDNAATTKTSPIALKAFERFSTEFFYNPSAAYSKSNEAKKLLDEAREVILNKIGAKSGTVIFTGSATEANNLAILGSVKNGENNYVFSAGEHPSVYNTAKSLMDKCDVRFVNLKSDGTINLDELKSALSPKTRLVSVMYVSNETGAVNNILEVSKIVRSVAPRALIHVDAVQGFCKLKINVDKWDIDLLSFSGHKFHAPKGVGGLYVRDKNALKSIIFGGGQEFGLRSGTENLPLIMAMTEVIKSIDVDKNFEAVSSLKRQFLENLDLNKVKVFDAQSPYILSISFPGVNGETLMRDVEDEVIVGTGSACSSKKAGNRVLENIGISKEEAKSSIRVSFNYNQSSSEVIKAAKILMQHYKNLLERMK